MLPKTQVKYQFRGSEMYVGDLSGNVSQFDPSGQVSAGQKYLPDEVAKEMVDRFGLRKSSTLSKRAIVGYLSSLGLSGTMAPEVAMSLRNHYGVTPTFDEEKSMYRRSGQLIEELMGVVDESYPAPFVNVAPRVLTEDEAFREAVLAELAETASEEDRVILREFSEWSFSDACDLVELIDDFSDEGLDLLQDCCDAGGPELMVKVVEAVYRPHLARTMSEEVQGLAEVAVSTMIRARSGKKKPASLRQKVGRVDLDPSAKASRMKKVAGKAGQALRALAGKLRGKGKSKSGSLGKVPRPDSSISGLAGRTRVPKPDSSVSGMERRSKAKVPKPDSSVSGVARVPKPDSSVSGVRGHAKVKAPADTLTGLPGKPEKVRKGKAALVKRGVTKRSAASHVRSAARKAEPVKGGGTSVYQGSRLKRVGGMAKRLLGKVKGAMGTPAIDRAVGKAKVGSRKLAREGQEPLGQAVFEELAAVTSDEEFEAVREVSEWSEQLLLDVVDLAEDFGDEGLDVLEECMSRGGAGLAVAVVEAVYRPHLARFMSEDVQELAEVAVNLANPSGGSDRPGRMKRAAGALGDMFKKVAGQAKQSVDTIQQARVARAPVADQSKKKAGDSEKGQPGLLRRMAGAVGKVAKIGLGTMAGAVKGAASGASKATQKQLPGLAQAAGLGQQKSTDSGGLSRTKKILDRDKSRKSRGSVPNPSVSESSDWFFNQVADALGCSPDDVELEDGVPDPEQVGERLYVQDVVDQSVVESLANMGWEEISEVANVMLMDPQHTLQLLYALREGVLPYRREWNVLSESVSFPLGLEMSAVETLGRLTLDEGVVPKVLFLASRMLQEASGTEVEGYVRESYPELGQTVYGPAGDPKEGPGTTRDYMTPHWAGTDVPTKEAEVQQVRTFTDPAERAQKREAMRKEVEDIIGQMATAADQAGVPPEGMFLNKWRDLHRERVRYS